MILLFSFLLHLPLIFSFETHYSYTFFQNELLTTVITLPSNPNLYSSFRVQSFGHDGTKDDILHFVLLDFGLTLSWTHEFFSNVSSGVTLCPRFIETSRNITLLGKSSSKNPLFISLTVESVNLSLIVGDSPRDFTVESTKSLSFVINPPNVSYRDHFTLVIDSLDLESQNVCMVVAINPNVCPPKNTEESVMTSRVWQTALQKASLTFRAKTFAQEPFLVSIVLLENDSPCYLQEKQRKGRYKRKNLRLSINYGLPYSSYVAPIIISISCLFLVVVLSCVLILTRSYEIRELNEIDGPLGRGLIASFGLEENEAGHSLYLEFQKAISRKSEEQNSLITLRDIDALPSNRSRRNFRSLQRLKDHPSVEDFTLISSRDKWYRRNRSLAYAYLLPLISLYYFIPAIQFVFMSKYQELTTGSQDLCFHNFRCSRPLNIFSDFNHVFSNISYVIYGVAFIILVWIKSLKLTKTPYCKTGVPQQFGIFYALGFALLSQGVFSLIYHVCPTNLSLQFDTTMMYVIVVLCIIKIYQFRHPDATANAYSSFAFIRILIFLEALALYTSSMTVYLPFLLLYLTSTSFIAIDVYYMGIERIDIRLTLVLLRHLLFFSWKHPLRVKYPRRFLFSTLFLLGNSFYAIYLTVDKARVPHKSLSHVVLFILTINLSLYLFYYIFRKMMESTEAREENEGNCFSRALWSKMSIGSLTGIGSVAFGFLGIYLYTQRTANRNLSPAESRNLNENCAYFDFFDNHDAWHFIGGTGVF